MKRSITVTSLTLTLEQDMDIQDESNYVLMNYGPVRAGLTTLQGTLGPQHTELLNSCLRSLEILQSKSYTGYDTLRKDTVTLRALPYTSTIDTTGTDVIQ